MIRADSLAEVQVEDVDEFRRLAQEKCRRERRRDLDEEEHNKLAAFSTSFPPVSPHLINGQPSPPVRPRAMDSELPATPLYLPFSLNYPITIQRLHHPASSSVSKTQPLFTYSYYSTNRAEGTKDREVKVWESPVEGIILKWAVRDGQVINDAR
jgi:hypothetical protein